MKQEKNTILKNVLTANSIETRGWSLAQKENLFLCNDCKSPLCYVRKEWAVVEEKSEYSVMGYKFGNRYLVLREIGLAIYCAECGEFQDDFSNWAYQEDKIVCSWDDEELDIEEHEVIQSALNCYNHTGEIKGFYESSGIKYLRKKVKEYEEKNTPEKIIKKLNKEIKEIREEVKKQAKAKPKRKKNDTNNKKRKGKK